MEHLLLIIIGILLLIVFVLLAKVWFLRKSAQEIREAFRDRLAADTNTLIDISTRDPYMRKLAATSIPSFACSVKNAIVTSKAIWN